MTASSAPRFSVVIPSHQGAALLPRALESVLRQDLAALELIVVDDGSTDGTEAVPERYDDPRLRWIRQPHRGVSAARNRGAAEARAPWLVFLDSDDEALPGWLARFDTAARAGTGLVTAGCLLLEGEAEEPEPQRPEPRPELGGLPGLLLAGTFAVQRHLFESSGGYDEELHFAENTDLLIRLVELCTRRGLAVVATSEPGIVYHRAVAERRHRADTADHRLRAIERLLNRHGDLIRRHSRRTLADYHAVAGVSAARLGDGGRAMRHLGRAAATAFWIPKHLARLAAALLPPLRDHLWRPPEASPAPRPRSRQGTAPSAREP